MPKSLLIVCDYLPLDLPWNLPAASSVSFQSLDDHIPDKQELKRHDLVLVLGQLKNSAAAIQFAGALRLAVEEGLTSILTYPVRLSGADYQLLEQLVPDFQGVNTYGQQEWSVIASHPAFHEFFAVFGRSGSVVHGPHSESEVLGRVEGDPAAFATRQGAGWVYVLPFHVADIGASYNKVVNELLAAIEQHIGDTKQDTLPEHVEALRLPGEDEVLAEIAEGEATLVSLRQKATALARYRHLIGTATGDNLEELSIDALNLILEESNARAENREDVGAEDFWLVDPEGDIALAEVKGIRTHVKRANVNQVDDHREANDLRPDEMPGLLIVNVFRNTLGDEAAQRELEVNPDVVAHAVRNNVLILRTYDLFYLLHRKMAGEDAGQELLTALTSGGGWLQVDRNAAQLQKS